MNKKDKRTIQEVIKGGLCTGCGTCVGICPKSSIKMIKNNSKAVYLPKIDNKRCIQCGLCYEACPGQSVNFKELNLDIFGREPEDSRLGNYIRCYTGHSTDYEIRYNSASGGLLTAVLLFALQRGIIDGALVTRMKKDNPLEPEPFIARTKEEIIEASKSKYCPVPANVVLKEILKENGKFAVVGLPCHIHGIRKAEAINKKLKDRIVLHMGLFCHHAPTFLATEFTLNRNKIKKEEIKEISYRGEGWPGAMRISLESGDVLLLLHDYWVDGFGNYTFPTRCTLCCDMFCELPDISFGDAWLPEFDDDKVGKSIIVCRSKAGEDILQRAFAEGMIELNEISGSKVVDTQPNMLPFKKVGFERRAFLFKLLGRKVPSYNTEFIDRKVIGEIFIYYLASLPFQLLFYIGVYIASKPFLWGILLPYSKFVVHFNKLISRIVRLFPYRPM